MTTTLSYSSGAGVTFYSDSTCATTVTTASGTSSASIYWKDTKSGAPTLTASATGFGNGTQAETVNAAAANTLAFSTLAQNIGAGTCSATTTAQTRDAFGNVSNVTSALVVNLATTSGGGTFYSNSTCTTVATTATVGSGTSSANF